MVSSRVCALGFALATGLLVAACSGGALLPPSSGSAFGLSGDTSGLNPPPPLGTTDFAPPGVTGGPSTGTAVNRQIRQLRGALEDVQDRLGDANTALQEVRRNTVLNAQQYNGLKAAISARLQVGTTPGNPVLVSQWNQAQQQLNQMSTDIAAMTRIANQVASDSSRAAFLVDNVQSTFQLRGAVEEDHRQLAVLQDELYRTVNLIDRLVTEVTDDIARESAYLGTERANLNTLFQAIDAGQFYGTSLGNRAVPGVPSGSYASATPYTAAPPRATAAADRPLVVIRFDRPNVAYQQALYSAASQALQRKPDAGFDVVAVTPAQVAPGRSAISVTNASRSADQVARTLAGMGVPPTRIARAARRSPTAQTAEVHVYVR